MQSSLFVRTPPVLGRRGAKSSGVNRAWPGRGFAEAGSWIGLTELQAVSMIARYQPLCSWKRIPVAYWAHRPGGVFMPRDPVSRSRRGFLKMTAAVAGASALPDWFVRECAAQQAEPASKTKASELRIGIIGCGGQGMADAERAASSMRASPTSSTTSCPTTPSEYTSATTTWAIS